MEETNNTYESKKIKKEQMRDEERKRTQKNKTKKMIVRYAILVLVIAGISYGIVLLARFNKPKGADASIGYDAQGGTHIAVGESHPPYNSNPPSSGWHYASPARGGFYDTPLSDEQVIHNLEHGDIWIAYRPDLSDQVKKTLESFAGQYVVVSPRVENAGDISLVAWGRADTFNTEHDSVDTERIKDFIKRYDNKGPENLRGPARIHGGR